MQGLFIHLELLKDFVALRRDVFALLEGTLLDLLDAGEVLLHLCLVYMGGETGLAVERLSACIDHQLIIYNHPLDYMHSSQRGDSPLSYSQRQKLSQLESDVRLKQGQVNKVNDHFHHIQTKYRLLQEENGALKTQILALQEQAQRTY